MKENLCILVAHKPAQANATPDKTQLKFRLWSDFFKDVAHKAKIQNN